MSVANEMVSKFTASGAEENKIKYKTTRSDRADILEENRSLFRNQSGFVRIENMMLFKVE